MPERKYDIPRETVMEAMEFPAPYETIAELIDLLVFMARIKGVANEFMGDRQTIKSTVENRTVYLQGYMLDSGRQPVNITEMPNLSELASEFPMGQRRGNYFPNRPLVFGMEENFRGTIITKERWINFDGDRPTILRSEQHQIGVMNGDELSVYDGLMTVADVIEFLESLSKSQQNQAVRDFAREIIKNAKTRALNLVEAKEANAILSREIEKLRLRLGDELDRRDQIIGSRRNEVAKLRQYEATIRTLKQEVDLKRQALLKLHYECTDLQRDQQRALTANQTLRGQLQDVQAQLNSETTRADKAEVELANLYVQLGKRGLQKAILVLGVAAISTLATIGATHLFSKDKDPQPDDDDTAGQVGNNDDDTEEKTPELEQITPPTVQPKELVFQNGVRGELFNGTGELPDGEIETIYLFKDIDEESSPIYAIVFDGVRGFEKGAILPRFIAVHKPGNKDQIGIKIKGGGTFVYNWRALDRNDYPDDTVKYVTPWKNQEIDVIYNGALQIGILSDEQGIVSGAFIDELKSFQAYSDGQVEVLVDVEWEEEPNNRRSLSNATRLPLKEFLRKIKRVQ